MSQFQLINYVAQKAEKGQKGKKGPKKAKKKKKKELNLPIKSIITMGSSP